MCLDLEKCRKRGGAVIVLGVAFLTMATLFAGSAFANGEIIEVTYSTEVIVRLVIAVLGGLLAIFGVFLTIRAARTTSDVEVALDTKRLTLKRVSQGVVIVLMGSLILVASLYFLPERSAETTITGEEITKEPDGTWRAQH